MVRRRKFSDEYKREAVRLATQPGVTKSQVAQELGINANLLGWWCRDFAANGAAAFRSTFGSVWRRALLHWR
jgi:transposase